MTFPCVLFTSVSLISLISRACSGSALGFPVNRCHSAYCRDTALVTVNYADSLVSTKALHNFLYAQMYGKLAPAQDILLFENVKISFAWLFCRTPLLSMVDSHCPHSHKDSPIKQISNFLGTFTVYRIDYSSLGFCSPFLLLLLLHIFFIRFINWNMVIMLCCCCFFFNTVTVMVM